MACYALLRAEGVDRPAMLLLLTVQSSSGKSRDESGLSIALCLVIWARGSCSLACSGNAPDWLRVLLDHLRNLLGGPGWAFHP